jgi:hypothetical protein
MNTDKNDRTQFLWIGTSGGKFYSIRDYSRNARLHIRVYPCASVIELNSLPGGNKRKF